MGAGRAQLEEFWVVALSPGPVQGKISDFCSSFHQAPDLISVVSCFWHGLYPLNLTTDPGFLVSTFGAYQCIAYIVPRSEVTKGEFSAMQGTKP